MALFVRARRVVDRGFERLSARPLGIIVFAASVAMLVMLQNSQVGRFRVRALAEARIVEHPAVVQTVVDRTHVRPGDVVEAGELMVELSPRFVNSQLAEIDAKIEQVRREAALAAAELAVAEERWLNAPDRRRPIRLPRADLTVTATESPTRSMPVSGRRVPRTRIPRSTAASTAWW